ncbi:PaaI family thioesterase [Nocardia sp. NPDC052566]|uniref:PaaI family thioesterase n=1 Tax=Nocardia sp. NPDC052566 TaxID=3364330 RepID=UPI0037CA1CE8
MSDDATIHGHEEILKQTIELFRSFPAPPGINLELPPPSSKTLDIQFEEYVPGKSLTATLMVPKHFGNAVGLLQGGFIAALFDDLMGPLSYLIARSPTTSMELTTHFLRPVFVGEQLKMTATVRKAGRTAVYLAAEAYNGGGKLVATAMSTIQVIPLPSA